ncbi:MAG: 3-oxoacyl-[acyl-carrier-protein] reductase [Pseudomonadota bacterium]|nr:3-oxoacyl-[acyl-carrier-protein] reductase [Pseudomonadota bacterium]
MKRVLVTGASGGIGKAICELLHDEYEIFVIGRDKSKILNLCKEIKNIKGYFICDLSKQEDILRMIDEISDRSVEIDILINNAGVTNDSLFLRMDASKWDNVVYTNLNANFLLTNAVAKKMIKKKWGRIINITSVIGHTGNFGQSNYSASKAGVVGMSKSIALELAKRNITVNCISPGFIDTNMTGVLTDEQKESIIEKIPMGTIGKPEDVAYCVQFLASEKSKYITGQTFHVNGGIAML